MFKLKPDYPIVIDIGDQSISAIQLKETRHGLAVREWCHQQFDDDFDDDPVKDNVLVNTLKKMRKKRKFVGRRAIVLIPTANVSSFPIRFKVEETENVESVIVRESIERITIPINEAIIDYTSVSRTGVGEGNQYNATVISVKKDLIKQYILMLKQSGLSAEVVDYGLSSLIRLHQYLYDSIQDTVILCHIGYKESLLSILSNDGILAQRNIRWGIQPIFEKLQQNLELANDGKAAKTLLKKYGLIYEHLQKDKGAADIVSDIKMDSRIRPTYQIIVPYINKLIHEFQTMIAYVRSEQQDTAIRNIYIYGQGVLINHLDQFIERGLNIKAELVNFQKKIPFSDESTLTEELEDIPLTLAMGMGMRKVKWL
jgi:type IV pilus assembly protein PilM